MHIFHINAVSPCSSIIKYSSANTQRAFQSGPHVRKAAGLTLAAKPALKDEMKEAAYVLQTGLCSLFGVMLLSCSSLSEQDLSKCSLVPGTFGELLQAI